MTKQIHIHLHRGPVRDVQLPRVGQMVTLRSSGKRVEVVAVNAASQKVQIKSSTREESGVKQWVGFDEIEGLGGAAKDAQVKDGDWAVTMFGENVTPAQKAQLLKQLEEELSLGKVRGIPMSPYLKKQWENRIASMK